MAGLNTRARARERVSYRVSRLITCPQRARAHIASTRNRTPSILSSLSELFEEVRGGVVLGNDTGGGVVGIVGLLEADLANNNTRAYHKGGSVLLKMAADAAVGSDTCPSPEMGDSRKRPLEGDATENGTTKRSHYSTITPNNNNNNNIMNATANAVGKFHLNPSVNKIPSPSLPTHSHPQSINQSHPLMSLTRIKYASVSLYPSIPYP